MWTDRSILARRLYGLPKAVFKTMVMETPCPCTYENDAMMVAFTCFNVMLHLKCFLLHWTERERTKMMGRAVKCILPYHGAGECVKVFVISPGGIQRYDVPLYTGGDTNAMRNLVSKEHWDMAREIMYTGGLNEVTQEDLEGLNKEQLKEELMMINNDPRRFKMWQLRVLPVGNSGAEIINVNGDESVDSVDREAIVEIQGVNATDDGVEQNIGGVENGNGVDAIEETHAAAEDMSGVVENDDVVDPEEDIVNGNDEPEEMGIIVYEDAVVLGGGSVCRHLNPEDAQAACSTRMCNLMRSAEEVCLMYAEHIEERGDASASVPRDVSVAVGSVSSFSEPEEVNSSIAAMIPVPGGDGNHGSHNGSFLMY